MCIILVLGFCVEVVLRVGAVAAEFNGVALVVTLCWCVRLDPILPDLANIETLRQIWVHGILVLTVILIMSTQATLNASGHHHIRFVDYDLLGLCCNSLPLVL